MMKAISLAILILAALVTVFVVRASPLAAILFWTFVIVYPFMLLLKAWDSSLRLKKERNEGRFLIEHLAVYGGNLKKENDQLKAENAKLQAG